ncbi:MAG TPA: DegT/DnrJ/EryC1/StrS family aminotransferase [Chroococcidiopsis sp.]
MSFIPPFDLTEQYKVIGAEISAAVADVLASGRYINGPVVESFERQFADYIGTAECVACNSGTDALFMALRALNIGPGDEVITVPFTFFATAETISAVGATPVFVDIDLNTFNLDVGQVAAAITPRTKAIMPVHLFGQAVDMTALMAIANDHQLWVIEDCAQATGAAWAGAKVGSIGHIGCFSFYPTKNLGGCGDGGAVTTQDGAIANSLRVLRNHGQTGQYRHAEIGLNSRLDAVQAAILQIKLRYLDQWNAQRTVVAKRYHQLLQAIPGIICPTALAGGNSVWNQYTLRIVGPEANGRSGNGQWAQALEQGTRRDRVRLQLQQQGISSTVYYPIPMHLQPVYQQVGYQVGQFPNAERACQEVLSIPMFPELAADQQEQVAYGLKDSLLQVPVEV